LYNGFDGNQLNIVPPLWHGGSRRLFGITFGNVCRILQSKAFLIACGWLLVAIQQLANASEAVQGVTAVASKVSEDYVRAKLPDGSFKPEYYSFGPGGKWGGEINDVTIDKLRFLDVAHVIAVPLAGQSYLPATDPKTTRLLIMVYWGTTAVPESADNSMAYSNYNSAEASLKIAMSPQNPEPVMAQNAVMAEWSAAMTIVNIENQQRTQTNWRNAAMLGYDAAGVIGTEYGNHIRGSALGLKRDDLVTEIEENRYFVVLMAYDFQLLWKQRKHKLLWETRFSISERRNAFDKALPVMAQYASRYFGQDSGGLMRERVPEGQVDIGELKSLGAVSGK
jgi:hypothetical protein